MSDVSSAVFFTACPILYTASMFIPAFVVATLTDEQTRPVSASASGMLSISLWSAFVKPLCTRAEKPPMKFTPTASAALSRLMAKPVKLSVRLLSATTAIGVTEILLFTIGRPYSLSIFSPVLTRLPASRQILS
ncbi:MAG: hypothetical protein BWY65_01962 [Firmicutes bacterium ADurb.Bin373]|nr:MAG: hypothetical protein BWY65_01962 [Firmicutes bacterium ADurb.Bin373]